ncbi:adenylate/guanylate cyclase domain-containing protein [Spirochaetia bacterium 38H-sp]|uniref:Adenylate/guanylate cyclase domain-containing protein n=1 Tax=Rarispira pelagica TaxID=3141764 RepID=A0ABU9UBH4_9SPIR
MAKTKFTETELREHIEYLANTNKDHTELSDYINLALRFNNYIDSQHPDIIKIKALQKNLESENKRKNLIDKFMPSFTETALENIEDSTTRIAGIAFADIAEYSFLSKFLSPKENQILLNGLFTALISILLKNKGILNKIEGDSLMFCFFSQNEPHATTEEEECEIAEKLFNTCIKMQRAVNLFNKTAPELIKEQNTQEEKNAIKDAYSILSAMREDEIIARAFNALFQIKIRVGADIGEASLGNLGSPELKHFDIIGGPAIGAKRMETSSPIDGLRISRRMYNLLEKKHIPEKYARQFRAEAKKHDGYYSTIKTEEIFREKEVIIYDKNNQQIPSVSIQVNPLLPEDICKQTEMLLERKEEFAIERILNTIRYYRGNRLVIQAIEDLFKRKGIVLRKHLMYKFLAPKQYKAFKQQYPEKQERIEHIKENMSLFTIFSLCGMYQDRYSTKTEKKAITAVSREFSEYDRFINTTLTEAQQKFKTQSKLKMENIFFDYVRLPVIMAHIQASLMEWLYKEIPQELGTSTLLKAE